MINNFSLSTQQIIENNKHLQISYIKNDIKNDSENNVANKNEDLSYIMITGASGFLGLSLINQLINKADLKKIVCVMRDPVKFKLNKEKFKFIFDESKLIFIFKDIIDLGEDDLKNVTRVIHSAAEVNALKNFNQLKHSNVLASINLYKLCDKLSIPISLISTLSVFVSSNQTGLHKEELLLPSEEHLLYGGYAQTKWLAEYLAPSNTQIFRLGLLTGSETTGIFPEKDFFKTILKLLKEMNSYPENYQNAWVDISPVDKVAQIITDNLGKNNIIHIANKKSTSIKTIFSTLKLLKESEEKFNNKFKTYPTINQILLRNACFKNSIIFKYFNIDLFQSTNHYWSGDYLLEIDEKKILNLYLQQMKEEENEKI